MNKILASLIAAACLCAGSGYGQGIILSLSYSISKPGNYVLGKSLTFNASAGNAIQISASNVILDLLGNTLSASSNSGTTGIYVTGQNVTIQNGSITGFDNGIEVNYPSTNGGAGVVVQNVSLSVNSSGVNLVGATGCIIKNNLIMGTVPENLGLGAPGNGVGVNVGGSTSGGYTNVIRDNLIFGFSSGVTSIGTNYYLDNTVAECGTGLSLSYTDLYRGNTTLACGMPFSGGVPLTTEQQEPATRIAP